MILDRPKAGRRITLGADKAYDVTAFVKTARTSSDAAYCHRRTGLKTRRRAPDRRRWLHHPPSRIPGEPNLPQTDRKGVRLDQGAGRLAKVKVRGCAKVEAVFTFAVAPYDLIRIYKLLAQCAA